ncbi:DUF1446 domain-containing protein [soil metagenome]
MSSDRTRPVRIANASGFLGDRMSAMREVVTGGPIDVVTGDYLAELTMRILGKQKLKKPDAGYAATFLTHFEPILTTVMERGIKIVVNAGGLNPTGLAVAVKALGGRLGVAPKIATIHGDDLRPRLESLAPTNLETGAPFVDFAAVLTANAYLGAWGIVRALDAGADIVVCPRVTDASLVVGAAAWWHRWKRDEWDALAGAVAAGHVIECGAQATGGNYSGFRALDLSVVPGFPIAEVARDGTSVVTKHPGAGGAVTVGTVTAQLVYEVQTTRYKNPDVTTLLDTITLEQIAPNRVALRGTRGAPPPETTKVAVTTRGLHRNEIIFAFVGLDVDAKMALFESQARAVLDPRVELHFQRIGASKADPTTEDEATVLLRIVASSGDEAAVSRAFSGPLIELGLASYPGLFALTPPGPAMEVGGYAPLVVAQSALEHSVTLPDGTSESIPLPPFMADAPPAAIIERPRVTHGPCRSAPLGAIVDARSGDKGSDANIGVWVSEDDAYAWLCDELSVARFRELLPEAREFAIERFDLPNLRALNFVVHGLLAGGAAAGARLDRQGKALGELLRARFVDVPIALLDRARSSVTSG